MLHMRPVSGVVLAGLMGIACAPTNDVAGNSGLATPLALLHKAEPTLVQLKSVVAASVRARQPEGIPTAPSITIDSAAVLEIEKKSETLHSPGPEPRDGDTARIEYAFSYKEAHGNEELSMEGSIGADFTFVGDKFVIEDALDVHDDKFGITDVMSGHVADCHTGTPLYKAEIAISFRDGMAKRQYTGQSGEYTIRAVKGEQVTVRASYANYVAKNKLTFVPDRVDFALCPEAVTPSPTTSGTKITYLSSGAFHTCAVTEGKQVWCWGGNADGQLGNNSLVSSPLPVTVSGLSNISQVEAGRWQTCALSTEGAVKCWGANTWGQLGDGTYSRSLVPVQVTGLTSGVRAIALGEGFACALKQADGSVVCWGLNNGAQIGNNSFNASSGPGVPAQVVNADGSPFLGGETLRAGGQAVCVTKSGALTCWGSNDFSQLALETATGPERCDSPYGWIRYCAKTPVATKVSANVMGFSMALYSGCALMNDNTVKCWGDNRSSQLGAGAVLDTCSVDNYATVSCGVTVRNVIHAVDAVLGGVSDLMAGSGNGFYCAVASNAVQCWGGVGYAAMGHGAPITGPTEMTLATAGLAKLSAGFYHVCGITPESKPECWGRNVEGQLGVGDSLSHTVPVRVRGF